MAKLWAVSRKKQKRSPRPKVVINVPRLDELVDKSGTSPLDEAERDLLKKSIHTMAERLKPRSATSEKARHLINGIGGAQEDDSGDAASEGAADVSNPAGAAKRRPGHGRNGAKDYVGATTIPVPHPDMNPKSLCPCCAKGRVYELKDPRPLVRIEGMPPLQATVYELQQLRCNLCGQVYRAPAPEGVGEEKYDATVPSMLALLKYGSGMPWYRIHKLQKQMGIPMPASTQWELLEAAATVMKPVHTVLTCLAAQGEVLQHDDTRVRILEEVERPEEQDEDRTGLQTTSILSNVGDHQIALFASGPNHAGENMTEVLKEREEELPPPVLMSDALSHNDPKVAPGVELLLSNCLTHGRRQFVDVFDNFPAECQHVILELGKVYWHDEQARQRGLDPEQRLRFHKEHSGPVMDELKTWMEAQMKGKTEPNSGLGKAINYFLKRWHRLTLFLLHPGAPLDNTAVERALKKAVLLRKNALFYKTLHGAEVGDLYMSLIYTCELNNVNAFRYLTELQRHAAEVQARPEDWLPWNYQLQTRPPPG